MLITLILKFNFSFWALATAKASTTAISRFVKHYELYTAAVCQQAEDRDNSFVRDIDSYMTVGRDTIGATSSFDLLLLDIEISDEKLDDTRIVELELLATDMIILANVSPFCSIFSRVGSPTSHGILGR